MERTEDFALELLEIQELGDLFDDLEERRKIISRQLRPFYDTRDRIKQDIIKTHHHRWVGPPDALYAVFVKADFSVEARARRAPLFPQLDELRQEYLPSLNEQRYCVVKTKEIARQIEHIEKWIKKQRAKSR